MEKHTNFEKVERSAAVRKKVLTAAEGKTVAQLEASVKSLNKSYTEEPQSSDGETLLEGLGAGNGAKDTSRAHQGRPWPLTSTPPGVAV